MPRSRRGRARVIVNRERPGRRSENTIAPSDLEKLYRLLLSKPQDVIARFEDLQIYSLAQLEGWEALKMRCPDACGRMIAIAALHGIPEESKEAA